MLLLLVLGPFGVLVTILLCAVAVLLLDFESFDIVFVHDLLDAFVVLNLRIVVGGDCTQIIFAIIVAHALLLLLRWQISSDPADMVESALIGPRATSVVARRHR